MLAAHLDEIGLIVSHVEARGFARFSAAGRVLRAPPDRKPRPFLNGAQAYRPRETPPRNANVAPPLTSITSTQARPATRTHLVRGDVAVFDTNFLDLGGRSFKSAPDDRVGWPSRRNHAHPQVQPARIYFVSLCRRKSVRWRGPALMARPEIGLSLDPPRLRYAQRPASAIPTRSEGPAIKVKDTA